MPVNQSGDHSTANIGTHNEYGSRQNNLALNGNYIYTPNLFLSQSFNEYNSREFYYQRTDG